MDLRVPCGCAIPVILLMFTTETKGKSAMATSRSSVVCSQLNNSVGDGKNKNEIEEKVLCNVIQ